MRIEICGGIAAGKTTLAHAVEEYDPRFTAVFEDFSSNTLLTDFYADISRYAYETEISFLLQHMHQIKATQVNCSEIVCDFSIEQDYAYALSNLEMAGQPSFGEVYKETVRQIKLPDLIVLLECPPHILLQRIHTRGRRDEAAIDAAYLESAIQSLKNHVFQQKNRVVVLDSHRYDFRKQDDMKTVMVEIFERP